METTITYKTACGYEITELDTCEDNTREEMYKEFKWLDHPNGVDHKSNHVFIDTLRPDGTVDIQWYWKYAHYRDSWKEEFEDKVDPSRLVKIR